jgi:hypothetical protein
MAFPARPVLAAALASLLSLCFALNGHAMVALQMPHYELLIPGLIAGMLALLLQARWRWALALLAITVLTREDAGLHVAALLLPVYLWRRVWAGAEALSLFERRLGCLGALGLAGALVCLAAQHAGWGDNGMLVRNYLGTPALAHLDAQLLAARWSNFVWERSYLWAPFVLACVWAALERRWLIVWGFVAYVPWLLLQSIAKENVMGVLSWYYGFPALASLVWPIVVWRSGAGATPAASASSPLSAAPLRRAVWWTMAILLSTMVGRVNGQYMVYPWQMLQGLRDPLASMQSSEAFMRVIGDKATAATLGQLKLDNGVIALRPHRFTASQRAEAPGIDTQAIDTLVWFDPGGFDNQSWALSEHKGLRYRFAVPRSPIVLASRFDLSRDAAWREVIVPTNLFARRSQSPLAEGAESGKGWRVEPGMPPGVVLRGPLVWRTDGLYQIPSPSMPAGRYQLEALLRVRAFGEGAVPMFVLQRRHNWAPYANSALPVFREQLQPLGGDRYRVAWPIEVTGHLPESYWPAMMQIEWLDMGQAAYTIESWSLSAVE